MNAAEAKFHEYEKALDLLLATDRARLEESGLLVKDMSCREYNYKVERLYWGTSLKRQWDIGLETGEVEVRVWYHEPLWAEKPGDVTVWLCVDKFRQGQTSSFREVKEEEISLAKLSDAGLASVVIKKLDQGARKLGTTL